jgi:cobalt-zinc-cadmium efflux system outer membrane protein
MLLFLLFVLAAQTASVLPGKQDRIGQAIQSEVKPEDLKQPRLPPGITLDRPLAAADAVAIALWNNAAFHADLANLGLARADLAEAGLLRNPNLSLLFPVGPKPFELALTLPIEALWQRPRRIEAAKVNLEAVSQGLVQHGMDLARDVCLAWVDLSFAQQKSLLDTDAAALKQRIAQLTERRLAAGDVSDAETGTARVEAIAARDTARRSEDGVVVATERLRMLIGLRGTRTPLKAAPLQEPTVTLPELDYLLESALAARPDLRAAELAVQAAAKRASWERSRVVALGLVLSSKEVGSYGVRTGPGLALDLPFFQRNQGSIRRADAEVERAAWQYLAARDRVELEVREARAQSVQAIQALDRLRREVIPAVRRNAEMAETAYRNGDLSFLTALEGSRPLTEVRLREAEGIAAVCRAAAQLERSIGRKP